MKELTAMTGMFHLLALYVNSQLTRRFPIIQTLRMHGAWLWQELHSEIRLDRPRENSVSAAGRRSFIVPSDQSDILFIALENVRTYATFARRGSQIPPASHDIVGCIRRNYIDARLLDAAKGKGSIMVFWIA
jgi:hypothetical protein